MSVSVHNARRWLGRATEARFVADAQSRGLLVSRPFTEAPGYDAIVDNGWRLVRVQIKGCTPNRAGYCRLNVNRHRRSIPRYDVLAVWMSSVGRWFFLPGRTRTKTYITLHPAGKYARTGWEILTR